MNHSGRMPTPHQGIFLPRSAILYNVTWCSGPDVVGRVERRASGKQSSRKRRFVPLARPLFHVRQAPSGTCPSPGTYLFDGVGPPPFSGIRPPGLCPPCSGQSSCSCHPGPSLAGVQLGAPGRWRPGTGGFVGRWCGVKAANLWASNDGGCILGVAAAVVAPGHACAWCMHNWWVVASRRWRAQLYVPCSISYVACLPTFNIASIIRRLIHPCRGCGAPRVACACCRRVAIVPRPPCGGARAAVARSHHSAWRAIAGFRVTICQTVHASHAFIIGMLGLLVETWVDGETRHELVHYLTPSALRRVTSRPAASCALGTFRLVAPGQALCAPQRAPEEKFSRFVTCLLAEAGTSLSLCEQSDLGIGT
jgi:hypothetical protein